MVLISAVYPFGSPAIISSSFEFEPLYDDFPAILSVLPRCLVCDYLELLVEVIDMVRAIRVHTVALKCKSILLKSYVSPLLLENGHVRDDR